MKTPRQQLIHARRWVIKIGSALLTRADKGLNYERIRWLSGEIAHLRSQGKEVVLVTSGSIAAGMQKLGWAQRPQVLHQLQAAASVGQMELIQAYASACRQYNIYTAQILLTHADLSDRRRYLNARSTLRNLLALKVLPVVNENDAIATDEIRFGDNDKLAAMTINLVEADVLVILTDQAGLFDSDPRKNSAARLITISAASNNVLDSMATSGTGALGRGGMMTKLSAARLASQSGAITAIVSGKVTNSLQRLATGEDIGTLLWPDTGPMTARQQWLASSLQPQGQVVLDDGAAHAICNQGKSVLSVGVTTVQGAFNRGDLVLCLNMQGKEIARGLINYSAKEASLMKGKPSATIEALLGYIDELELIHRDNMVITV